MRHFLPTFYCNCQTAFSPRLLRSERPRAFSLFLACFASILDSLCPAHRLLGRTQGALGITMAQFQALLANNPAIATAITGVLTTHVIPMRAHSLPRASHHIPLLW